MASTPVTDPALIAQLEGNGSTNAVTDPATLNQLNGVSPGPGGVNMLSEGFNTGLAEAADSIGNLPTQLQNANAAMNRQTRGMGAGKFLLPGAPTEDKPMPDMFKHLGENMGMIKDIQAETHMQKLLGMVGNIAGQASSAMLGSTAGTAASNFAKGILTGPLAKYTAGPVKELAHVAESYGIDIKVGHMLRPGAGARSMQLLEGSLGGTADSNQRMLERNILSFMGEPGDYITESTVNTAEKNISGDYTKWLAAHPKLTIDSSIKPQLEQLKKIQSSKLSGLPNSKLQTILGNLMKGIPVHPKQGVATYQWQSGQYKELMSELNREISRARGTDDNLARLYSEVKIGIQQNVESHLPPIDSKELRGLDAKWNMLGFVRNSGMTGWGVSPNKFSKAVENYLGENRWASKPFHDHTAYDLAKLVRTFPHAFANNNADVEIPVLGKGLVSGAAHVASHLGTAKILGSKPVQSALINKAAPMENPVLQGLKKLMGSE